MSLTKLRNYLQIITLVFMLLCIETSVLSAQSYYNSPNDTIMANAVWDDVNVYNIMQTHPTNDTLFFKIEQNLVDMPIGWEASICTAGNCFTNLVDTCTMGPIVYGDDGLMSLHIRPFVNTGTAIIRYTMYATNTPLQIDTLTWIITCNTPTQIINQETKENHPLMYYANGDVFIPQLKNEMQRLTVKDLYGRCIYSCKIFPNQSHYYLPKLVPNIYVAVIDGNNFYYTQKINKSTP